MRGIKKEIFSASSWAEGRLGDSQCGMEVAGATRVLQYCTVALTGSTSLINIIDLHGVNLLIYVLHIYLMPSVRVASRLLCCQANEEWGQPYAS
jgi:hypothetical protein